MNRVQHDDVVRETSPVVEAPEVTLVYQLTLFELTIKNGYLTSEIAIKKIKVVVYSLINL
jgi:hypothetical protein